MDQPEKDNELNKSTEPKSNDNKNYVASSTKTNDNEQHEKSFATNKENHQDTIVVDPELDLQEILENERRDILERNQILSSQQRKFHPLSTGMFFFMELVTIIFPLNIILIMIWSFRKNTNVNRKAYARSILIWGIVLVMTCFIFTLSLAITGYPINLKYWFLEFRDFINSIDV